ncbi:MAG: biotin--[acetyl-CoA-carboxylase] ligase [Candidatus Aminicenantes bacterium]|nr:biotin--[acetyl-CoA-carboxylase] ligase [Candidatus Aminicenantes bacterium]
MKKYNMYPGFLEVIELESCDSTNNYLKKNYEQLKSRLPVLITAAQQTRGRGRRDRTWQSQKYLGLYSTFGFYLESGSKLPLLPLTAGISVIETLNKITRFPGNSDGGRDFEFGLKWPNDILAGNRKISGILIENTMFKEKVFSVTGIGINLNHTTENFPGSLKDTATSLRLITGKTGKIEKVNKVLSHIFFSWLAKLKNNEHKEIIEQANRYSGFLKDRPITFHQDDKITSAIFRGINNDGGIILEGRQGTEKIYYSGEISPVSYVINNKDKK